MPVKPTESEEAYFARLEMERRTPALAAQEKSHLVLCEPTSLPVGPKVAHNPGRHKSVGQPGRTEPCPTGP